MERQICIKIGILVSYDSCRPEPPPGCNFSIAVGTPGRFKRKRRRKTSTVLSILNLEIFFFLNQYFNVVEE